MEFAEYAHMHDVEDRMWWYRARHTRIRAARADAPDPSRDAGCGTGIAGSWLGILGYLVTGGG